MKAVASGFLTSALWLTFLLPSESSGVWSKDYLVGLT